MQSPVQSSSKSSTEKVKMVGSFFICDQSISDFIELLKSPDFVDSVKKDTYVPG